MRLALTLLRKKMPNGHIYIGKHRMIPKPTPEAMEGMTKRLQVEERNMFILRHPYLTIEQSFGHAGALGKSQAFFQRRRNEEEKWMPNVTLEERFETLRNDDKWD
ncbi:ribosomal protein 63, mitochondrial-like [Eriocheir sinensis]|uniref:ribosomal protein 63, mitochondrial-like n=1 Tax=Eriocheir sinensis TaxID=95602 RepID=UPI0021C75D90|nr:ribosomal protein 63, mitochondrial-like [Eriocheir sinensis]